MHSLILGFPATALHEAAAAAVARVLEAHEIEVEWTPLPPGIQAGSPDDRLGRGEIDMFVAAWLPRTDAALLSAGMQPLGLLYRPALIWCVADADGASRIDQLAASDRFDRRIVVPHAGPIAEASEQVIAAYRLDAAGYVMERVSEAEALAWATAADASRIVPLCRPHALLHASALREAGNPPRELGHPVHELGHLPRELGHPLRELGHPLRELGDPLQALGAEQQARLLLRHDLRPLLDRDLIDELDELTLGNKVVSAMAHAMQFEGMSAEAAADAWQRGKLTPRG